MTEKEEKVGKTLKVPHELQDLYNSKVVPSLKEEFKYKSSMQVPKITKVVINIGLGRSTQNIKVIEQGEKVLEDITGQKPVRCKSKKAISNFKLRAGLPIGVMVTLRGPRMWEFLERLVCLTLPRIRDFRGISDKGFDGHGNYTLGIKDQLVFPEISYELVDQTFGMNITIVTTGNSDNESKALLTHLGFPFRKRKQEQQAA